MKQIHVFRHVGLGATSAAAFASICCVAAAQTKKPFEEYLKPTPTVTPLSSATWGVAGVLPRDLSNGIENAKGAGVHPDYYYWDGQIIRAKDGKFHLFMSTFSGDTNFGTSWQSSDAFHAISQTNVLGPYLRQDFVYSNNGSHKGHNVSAVELPDGSYAVIVSEIVPFTIYKSNSLDGPWTGCQPTSQVGASNISLFPRHDGKFQIVERNGTIAIAETLCGTYVKQKPTCSYTQNATDSIYPKRTSIPGVSNPAYTWQEDPHIWRSGGTYHVIYSGSGDRVGWHVYSPDGLNWKDNGYAWSPRDYQKIFCYEGTTTCSQWYKMERPGVVLQDGHPTHITWAVSDVDKDNQVLPGTNHGTKIVVVPFDGVTFDNDFGVGGSGGTSGTGGSSSTAAGGKSSTGGTAGAGGSSAAGGAKATGGATTVAGGSAAATGGTRATSATSANGGSRAAGGTSTVVAGTGGTPSAGGTSNATGGSRGAGGGASSTGGRALNTGGNSLGVGGAPLTGGATSNSSVGESYGGAGATSSLSVGGSAVVTKDMAAASDGGCGCRFVGQRSAPAALGCWGALGALVLHAARRRARPRDLRRVTGSRSSSGR